MKTPNITKRFMLFVLKWREHRSIIKQLNQLTDRELDDMGINRVDIDRLVWHPEDYERRGKS
mgnify:CR=1 FL=1